MALELGEVVAAFDDGAAEVVYDSTGPFETIRSAPLVPVASFTMPHAGSIIATMWYTPGTSTSFGNSRRLAVAVGPSRVEAALAYGAETHILSCYGDLPAGEATILVASGTTLASGVTTPTRIRVITWSE